LRLHFPDSKHFHRSWNIRKFFSSFGNFWPTPQLYMLVTALPPPPPPPPPPRRQHFRETFLGALFILKVPLETRPPQLFEDPVIIYCLNCIRRDQNSTYKTGLRIFALTNTYKSSFALLTSAELLLISVPSLQTWTAQMVLYLVPTVYV
jgi:hypothetical protein